MHFFLVSFFFFALIPFCLNISLLVGQWTDCTLDPFPLGGGNYSYFSLRSSNFETLTSSIVPLALFNDSFRYSERLFSVSLYVWIVEREGL